MYMTTHTSGKSYNGLDAKRMASVARKNVPFCIPELADYSLRSLPNSAIICAVRAFPRDCVDFLRDWPSQGNHCLGLALLRWLMTPIEIVGGIFGLFAVGLIVLLIYKSTLTMREDDQLFLDDANSHMQEEQTELLTKVSRLTLPVRVFSIGSGVFLLVLVAMLIYQKLNEVQ